MNTLHATESYLSLLLSLPNLDPYTVLSVFFLTLARLLPVLALAPFLGSQNVPMTIRVMFGVALTAIFLPQNLLTVHHSIPFGMGFVFLCIKELVFGAVLGFLSSVPFYIAQMSGSLIDFQRGASSLQVTDPTTKSQTGSIGILYNLVLIAVFYSLGGPFFFFDGVATSYQMIPVDSFTNPDFFHASNPFWKMTFQIAQTMFTLCVQLAAPSLIGILLMDMFLGIANRLAPQVQIVFLGIPLKSWVGLALLTAAWALIIQVMGKQTLDWFKSINKLIQTVKFI
ncbi:MAG TPA: flagellar biosynthetic protein FliR [Chlamydiales bacterium]|nr:flagellar biosynthetic protein FliR [Chlamydiales bacterium]